MVFLPLKQTIQNHLHKTEQGMSVRESVMTVAVLPQQDPWSWSAFSASVNDPKHTTWNI